MPAPVKAPAQKVTLAVTYEFEGQVVPPGLTFLQRETFLRGCRIGPQGAAVFAMQDRAASLANVLGELINRSGDPQLIAQASKVVEKWNAEIEEAFNRRPR